MRNRIYNKFESGRDYILYNGDCMRLIKKIPDASVNLTLTSPPYCMGKEYESSRKLEDFVAEHERLLPEIYRITANGGHICWQVGYHVNDFVIHPLDYEIFKILSRFGDLHLRNRIIWTFGHGLHAKKRFSGRHETILWFTKGRDFSFNLDGVRIPQKYPGKRFYKGEKKGEPSSNPLGKNPGDVWDIPAVNAHHIEKTEHPCQFPYAIAQRLIRGLTQEGDIVFDPFSGSGTTGAASIMEKRRFIGAELSKKYWAISYDRCKRAIDGSLHYRSHEKPVQEPDPNTSVARKPVL